MTQAKYASNDAIVPESVQALLCTDKKLKAWIEKIGILALPKRQTFALVDALARSILYQQLHAKAAETIIKRLEALAGEAVFSAGTLARLSAAEYRSVGVSGNKAKALHSLADVAFSGGLPGPRQLMKLDKDVLIKMLSAIHGIGAWTVQMLLIFRLGRADIWPVDDFAVRKGVQIAHKMATMPTPKELSAMAEKHWAPHLTLAALYFWRITDLAKQPLLPLASAPVNSALSVKPKLTDLAATKKRLAK
jgi:DNA-3-methyladenine glycosylase II